MTSSPILSNEGRYGQRTSHQDSPNAEEVIGEFQGRNYADNSDNSRYKNIRPMQVRITDKGPMAALPFANLAAQPQTSQFDPYNTRARGATNVRQKEINVVRKISDDYE